MGLLSFLSRKHGLDTPASRSLKIQVYESTQASRPPVRGVYPVAGNGPIVLGGLARIHYSLPRQVPVLPPEEPPAPAPIVPLFREEEDVARPTSAPKEGTFNSHVAVPRIPNRLRKDYQRMPSPASIRRPIELVEAREPRQELTQETVERTRLRATRHARSHSVGAGRTFVDILDAQSAIGPSDFSGRVQAAGVRQYGEDVADRNIAANGHDLDLGWSETQEFYGRRVFLPRNSSLQNASRMAMRGPDVRSYFDSETTSSRTRSLNSTTREPALRDLVLRSQQTDLPARIIHPGSLHDAASDTVSVKLARRQSVNSYISSRATSETPDLDDGLRARRVTLQPASAVNVQALDLSRHDAQQRDAQGVQSDAHVQARRVISGQDRQEALPQGSRHPQTPYAAWHSGHRGPPTALSSGALPKSKRHSLQTFHTSRSSSVSSRDTSLNFTPLSYPRDRLGAGVMNMERSADPRLVSAGMDFADPVAHAVEAAPPPSVKSVRIHSRTSDVAEDQHKSSPGGKAIENAPLEPPHWADNANDSVSSSAPTTASSGSNPFPRPTSRHTANTSVDNSHKDLTYDSGASVGDAEGNEAKITQDKISPAQPQNPNGESNFNIDDYVSSDDESFVVSPRERDVPDESLLFRNSGYGYERDMLPGLFDGSEPSGAPAARQFNSPPTQSEPQFGHHHGKRPTTIGRYDDILLSGMYAVPRRRYIVDVDADDWDDNGAEFDEHAAAAEAYLHDPLRYHHHLEAAAAAADEEEEELGIRRDLSPVRGRRGANRLSAIGIGVGVDGVGPRYLQHAGGGYHPDPNDTIEEERDDMRGGSGVDFAVAMRLRKEAKARQRARGVAPARRGGFNNKDVSASGTLGRRKGRNVVVDLDMLSAVGTGEDDTADADDEK